MILHSNIIGTGRPLIIMHGFLGMGDNWKTIAGKVADNGFEVHLIDARNHGKSFHSDDFTYDAMVEDLNHYIELNSLKDIVLMGHSMGGKTAMLYATSYPEVVSKLIVVDIAPRFYPIHHEDILKGLTAVQNAKVSSRNQASEILSSYVTDAGTRQFLLKNLYWNMDKTLDLRINLPVLANKVGEVGEALPSRAVYSKEALFLKGDRSEYISASDESDIQRHFPNFQLQTVSNSGHWLHAENPREFLELLMRFILN